MFATDALAAAGRTPHGNRRFSRGAPAPLGSGRVADARFPMRNGRHECVRELLSLTRSRHRLFMSNDFASAVRIDRAPRIGKRWNPARGRSRGETLRGLPGTETNTGKKYWSLSDRLRLPRPWSDDTRICCAGSPLDPTDRHPSERTSDGQEHDLPLVRQGC